MSAQPAHNQLQFDESKIDPDVPAQILEVSLDQWMDSLIGSFPVQRVQAELVELERKKGTIEAAIKSLNARLQVWAAVRAHQAGVDNRNGRPSKRDAVMTLVERDPFREFSFAEIRDYLVTHGLLDDSDKARHNIQVTLSNMVKRGELARPRKGVYKVAASAPADSAPVPVSPTNLHRKEADE